VPLWGSMYHLSGFKISSGGIFGFLWDLRVWVVCVGSCFLRGMSIFL